MSKFDSIIVAYGIIVEEENLLEYVDCACGPGEQCDSVNCAIDGLQERLGEKWVGGVILYNLSPADSRRYFLKDLDKEARHAYRHRIPNFYVLGVPIIEIGSGDYDLELNEVEIAVAKRIYHASTEDVGGLFSKRGARGAAGLKFIKNGW